MLGQTRLRRRFGIYDYLLYQQMLGGGAFSPTDISGLVVWLKADAGTFQDAAKTTPATNDGDVIGAWADQSGNGNDVTQATTGNKPTLKLAIKNGRPVIRFDGAGDNLQGVLSDALSQPFTIFAVAALDAVAVDAGAGIIIDGDDVTNRAVLEQQSQGGDTDTWSIYAGSFVTGGVSDSNWNIWAALFNGASSEFWINGASEASGGAGASNPDGITVGTRYLADATSAWDGDVAEVIIYDPSLSTADRQQVEQYLSTRWGITLS
jgi:hypothetical protein